MRDIKYKGYWISIKKRPHATWYDITVTNHKFYYCKQVQNNPDRKELLKEFKDIVEEGVKLLDKQVYPVTGRPVSTKP